MHQHKEGQAYESMETWKDQVKEAMILQEGVIHGVTHTGRASLLFLSRPVFRLIAL